MLPRVLSFAIPLLVYTALMLVAWGLYRERGKFDRWALILAAGAFLASLAIRPNEHLLFFDEDIYINIASNLSHAPIAQLTLLGSDGNIQASAYYKEPAGFPTLLSLVFLITGTREIAAFIFARVLYAMAVAATYLLAKEVTKTTTQGVIAAVAFAAAPACFAYSSSAGTDLAAALFAALGVWGLIAGNWMLAVGALAMAAQIRMEMIALVPLVFVSPRISTKWKLAMAALLAGEALHVLWVFSIAPGLEKAEHVDAAFAAKYVLENLRINALYLFDPRSFPVAATALAIAALFRWREGWQGWFAAWIVVISGVYLFFYAGSFQINPRYSIQITIPIVVLAVSLSQRRLSLAFIALAAAFAGLRILELPAYVRALANDHRMAVEFAQKFEPDTDLVISGEPEIFLNHGRHAMNAVVAAEHPERLRAQFGKYKRIFYYGGVRTNEAGNQQSEADRRVKSDFELHLVDSREFSGLRIAVYELLETVNREAR